MRLVMPALFVLLLTTEAWAALPPLIPAPREVREGPGTLTVTAPVHVIGVEAAPSAVEVLERTFGPRGEGGTAIRLALVDPMGPPREEWYRLQVGPEHIDIAAATEVGLFYGAQTLRQLYEGAGRALPYCDITDWPAMRWRGVDYPVTRAEDLQRLAGLKLNLVVWEVSGLFESPSHPELGGTMPLADIAAVCAEARRNHITLILEVQSFGHAPWLLRPHPEFRADPNGEETIRPFVPGEYELLSDVYGELIAASGVPWFFPGCDEPFQIDQWCRDNGRDPAEVVGKHIARLSEIAAQHGARVMVWGDYLLKYPQSLQYLDPQRVVIGDWHYNSAPEYPSVDTFVQAGFETLVCPSVCPWEPLFPDYAASAPNITNFVADGQRRGAIGLINTNWPTGPMPLEAMWYGWALGADASWRAEPVEQAAFDERFSRQYFGMPAETFAKPYFGLQALNRIWQSSRPADRSPAEALRDLAAVYAHKVIPAGGLFAQADLPALDKELSALDAMPAAGEWKGDGWRQFRALRDQYGRIFLPVRRSAGLGEAYAALRRAAKARAAGDEAAAGQAIEAAGRALTTLGALAEGAQDTETAKLVADARQRLGAVRGAGDCSPQAILGAPPEGPAAGPAEISPLAAHVPLPTPAAPPQARRAGLIFPQAGGGADLRFEVLEAGTYRVWALLRHSAGVWENGQFARGGRNAVYEGNYGWELDGQPLTETWFGVEVNPDEDEALQWAVLYEGELTAGPHVLRVQPRPVNYAIVDRLLFADDPGWKPPNDAAGGGPG